MSIYAGTAGTVLSPTEAAERAKIVAALDRLDAGGSTAGAEGIRQAYLLAEQHFVEDGINRVILATDGDFNVGIADSETLEGYIARKRDSGIYLSVLGFGMGNYNDELMQRLAQIHLFGTGLADERFVVEKFRVLANGEIRPVAPEAAASKGRRVVVSRREAETMRPDRTGIIVCTGLSTRGGRQAWGSVAAGLLCERRQRG